MEAHIAFLKHVSELLQENGEYVDGQTLTPARTLGAATAEPDAARSQPTARCPRPAISWPAGTWSTSSRMSARSSAAYISSEPGTGGEPLYEWIDVREVMTGGPSDD